MDAAPAAARIGSAAGAALVTAGLLALLALGLAGQAARERAGEALAVFRVAPPPPPAARIVPARRSSARPSGRAAPPALRSDATAVAAPIPVILAAPPPPIVVAVRPFDGAAARQGAAPVAGPGTGAGGEGDGTGAGGWGDGTGGGETPPRWRSGRLRDSDYPDAAGEAGFEGVVSVRFLVRTDGRVSECAVTRSSGNLLLDETTCRLIERRYRYHPSRDAEGRPVPAYILEDHHWVIERVAAEP